MTDKSKALMEKEDSVQGQMGNFSREDINVNKNHGKRDEEFLG